VKIAEAFKIINGAEPSGFMVSFEWIEDGLLRSDHFPDKHAGEKLIKDEELAWNLARGFARKTKGRCANIYVIKHDFTPVIDYRDQFIKNR